MVQVEKSKIIEAMKKVTPGIAKGGSTIIGADAFVFCDGYIHSYNDAVSVSAPCDVGGLFFAVKAVDFYNLVSRLTGEQVELDIVENKVKVKSGKTRASMVLIKSDDIQGKISSLNIQDVEFKPIPAEFEDASRICTIKTTAKSKGVAVRGNRVYSTDSLRVSVQDLDAPMDTLWIDDEDLNDALKTGTIVKYSVSLPWIHFQYDGGVTFSCKLKDFSMYPFDALDESITEAQVAEVKLSGKLPSTISEAVKRVSVLAGLSDDDTPCISMTFSKEGVTLYASKMGGDAEELVPWDDATGIPDDLDIHVSVDVKFLTEVAMKAVEFKILPIVDNETGESIDNFLFSSGDFLQLVMPAYV